MLSTKVSYFKYMHHLIFTATLQNTLSPFTGKELRPGEAMNLPKITVLGSAKGQMWSRWLTVLYNSYFSSKILSLSLRKLPS